MFGFGKRKKDHMAELAAVVAALALSMDEGKNPFAKSNKQIICDELDKLKKDHWDKNAFDTLKEFVKTL